jgi:hypothetical protein
MVTYIKIETMMILELSVAYYAHTQYIEQGNKEGILLQ